MFSRKLTLTGLALMASVMNAQAAEWSDTYIGYRHGSNYAEPFGANDITKDIFNLSHTSGYKYGTNFFNVDMLMSDSKDPSSASSGNGAQETYIVYRNTLDFAKIFGKPDAFKFGPIRDMGFTVGFDYNTKDDAGYNSKKRMLVAGPTVMLDVPGFLNASLVGLWESNAPYSTYTGTQTARYSYDTHPALMLAWGIPFSVGPVQLSYEGFANFIASKGKDEFGVQTKPETNIDMEIMYDVGQWVGAGKNTLKMGLEYQYWRNKFGDDHTGSAGNGAFAKTPMVRAEYHF